MKRACLTGFGKKNDITTLLDKIIIDCTFLWQKGGLAVDRNDRDVYAEEFSGQ